MPFVPLPKYRATGIACTFTHNQDFLASKPATPGSTALAARTTAPRRPGAAGRVGGALILSAACAEQVLISGHGSLSTESSVDGRQNVIRIPSDRLVASVPLSVLWGAHRSRGISKLRCSGFHILFAGYLLLLPHRPLFTSGHGGVRLSLPPLGWGRQRAGAEAGEKGRSSPSVRASSVPEPPVAVLVLAEPPVGMAVRFPSIVCLC